MEISESALNVSVEAAFHEGYKAASEDHVKAYQHGVRDERARCVDIAVAHGAGLIAIVIREQPSPEIMPDWDDA